MNTNDTPAALPATITLSRSNIRDFIEARGVNVPVIVAGQSLVDFIISTALGAAFNITKVPYKLKSDCQRAGQYASRQALLGWVNEQFPPPGDIPKPLPRYTVDNGMIVACEAAEKAIRPWVWGNAHHTNPNRQAAGRAGRAAAAAKAAEAAPQSTEPALLPVAAPVAVSDHQTTKTQAAVSLANSEFESEVPFSSAGIEVTTSNPSIQAVDLTAPVNDWTQKSQLINLESWLHEHGLRTMLLEGPTEPWICIVAGLTDDSIATKSGMMAALKQGIVTQGLTELQACSNYAGRNKLPWPESLAHALEQQAAA